MGQDLEWVVAAARRYERPLTAYVRRFLGDAENGRALDIVQEAILRLCKQSRLEVEPRLAPWLFTVCRRQALDILRKENRMTALSEVAEPLVQRNGPAEVAESADLNRAVLDRLAQLPPNQQEAVRLKFLQQFSYREIADVMEISESHVGVLIHGAVKKLRQTFAETKPLAGGIQS